MKKKILFIDDEAPVFARIFPRLMGEYDVRLESEAGSALQVAQEFSPDVFLLDLIMPTIHGLDLAAKLRRETRFSSTPIIIVSASVRSKENGEPGVAGDFPAFGKPFSIPALKRCIEEQLAQRAALDSAAAEG